MLDRKMKLCYDIPCVSQACVAQLDRASGYGPEGRGFESCRTQKKTMKKFIVFFSSQTLPFAGIAYLVLESAFKSSVEIKLYHFYVFLSSYLDSAPVFLWNYKATNPPGYSGLPLHRWLRRFPYIGER